MNLYYFYFLFFFKKIYSSKEEILDLFFSKLDLKEKDINFLKLKNLKYTLYIQKIPKSFLNLLKYNKKIYLNKLFSLIKYNNIKINNCILNYSYNNRTENLDIIQIYFNSFFPIENNTYNFIENFIFLKNFSIIHSYDYNLKLNIEEFEYFYLIENFYKNNIKYFFFVLDNFSYLYKTEFSIFSPINGKIIDEKDAKKIFEYYIILEIYKYVFYSLY